MEVVLSLVVFEIMGSNCTALWHS